MEDSKPFQRLQHEYPHLDGIKSIYLWGDPGCGKSFIAEKFFEAIDIKP